MNTLKLKIGFWAILFMAVCFSFLFYSSTVNHILGPGVALAADDPGCTNEDCPPDPGCTNEDCPPDPGCTNEDCPPDPGCTNEDCPPDYWDNCCCYEEYNAATERNERICCCKEEEHITCRKSYVISYEPPLHGLIDQIDIYLNACADNGEELCVPNWFSNFIGAYWEHYDGCSWWSDLVKDGIMAVEIDIKPGSSKNCININDHGVIPVAINGSQSFDVHQVDTSSLQLALLAVRVKGNGLPQCGYDDWNNDGQVDLICHFMDVSTDWESVNGEAILTGHLLDGTFFQGSDTACLVP